MQQRYYDPGIGRFLSVDPVTALSNPVGMFNRYKYAANNPYRFIDPDGRAEDDPEKVKRDSRSICRTNSCAVVGSGGRSRAEASQDREFARAQQDPSARQPLIDRMHAASGASGPSPVYDPNLRGGAGAVDTISGLMTIGPEAFDYENAADLGSVIFHERIHRIQFRDFPDFHVMAQDNRDHVLEFEAHSRTLSQENPFRSRMSNLYRTTAEAALQGHLGAMNATNRAIVLSGGTCATDYCSGGQ